MFLPRMSSRKTMVRSLKERGKMMAVVGCKKKEMISRRSKKKK